MAKRQHSEEKVASARRSRTPNNDRSLPASSEDDRRQKPAMPSTNEQSGSAGRQTGHGKEEQGKDTGQDRYGQSGFGGKKQESETMGQSSYRQSGPDGGEQPNPKSNRGSGRADRESLDLRQDRDNDKKGP